jgi:hypothetical protein
MRIILIFLLLLSANVYAQSPAEVKDTLFIVTYTTGPGWDQTKSPSDQPFFKEHSGFMSKLRKEGITKFGARYADKGIIVISATSVEKAKEIIFGDEAIENKLFFADVQKLNVFYEGCISNNLKIKEKD